MQTPKLQAIILAAGTSSRFNTSMTKLSFSLCGQELIMYPVLLLQKLDISYTLVLGFQKERLLDILNKHAVTYNYVEQAEQKGTGHAVLCTKQYWHAEHILIINGDMPLVTQEVIQDLINSHIANNATVSFVTSHNPDPVATAGYGRVIKHDTIISIVEARDYIANNTQEDNNNCCVNAGIYLIRRDFLEQALAELPLHKNSGEFYITDLIKKAGDLNLVVQTTTVSFETIRGINTLKELWIAEQIKRAEIINYWMDHGVRFIAAQSTHIDSYVTIEPNTTIGAGVQLRGKTHIGQNCSIDAFSIITDSILADNIHVYSHSVIHNSQVYTNVKIGPFAHIKNNSVLLAHSTIGSFVEVTKSTIGQHSKAKHLAYLGQAQVGSHVNIGAGAVTCNYNGVSKHTTFIQDGSFVGSNSSLVAPVTIGAGSLVGAGSVITKDVPADALALSRSPQVIKENYVTQLKERYNSKKKHAANKSNTKECVETL